MRTLLGTILVAAVVLFAFSAVFADVDAYGNEITYEADGITIKYRFWYSAQTAEAASVADSSSDFASPPGDFEPRYSTHAESDGSCHRLGLSIIIR